MIGFFRTVSLLMAALLPAGAAAASAEFQVDADYPGGNIHVERITTDTIFVAPDQRDTVTNQWWFYWNLRLRAPAGTVATVVFTGKNPIGVRGPATSADGGQTWTWLGAEAVRSFRHEDRSAWSFQASVPQGRDEVRYAFCPAYLESHLDSWIEKHGTNPSLRVEELCRSRKGRRVELLRAGCLAPGQSKGVVLLTSRHHCCETMATYVMEGFLEAVLADDDLGRRWRSTWEIIAVPFMDKDGVEDGDQGKYRRPHDHNRDYNDHPLYPEVAALMKLGASMKSRVVAALDLHCPYIRGEWNDRVYLVGAAEESIWENQKAFASLLEQVQMGPIRFRAQDCLPFGTAWNTGSNHGQGRSSSRWARDTFPKARLVSTIEIAYADALGAEVKADSARTLGHDLARALVAHLQAP